MGRRRLAALVVVLGCAAALLSAPAPAIVGGRAIAIGAAPWAVYINDAFAPDEDFDCSGSIIDPLHVVTAAHCLFNSSGLEVPLARMTVMAGVTDALLPGKSPTRQLRGVRSVRFVRGYVWKPGGERPQQVGTDIAVLRLTQPFDLDGPDVRAVALPGPSTRRPSGSGFLLNGFGVAEASAADGGILKQLSSTIFRASYCSSARVLCGSSPTGSSCPGDSGGGLVSPGRSPLLVGMLVTGDCKAGAYSSYVDLVAGPIRRFIAGVGGSPSPTPARPTRWVPAGWLSQTYYGKDGTVLPIVLSLPRSWISGTRPDGTRNVWDPLNDAEANVYVEGSYPSPGAFFSSILATARANYRAQDPSATIRSRLVRLPAGPSLQVVTVLTTTTFASLSVDNYNVFSDGIGYDVEYQGPPSADGSDYPVWTRSARTIHFAAPPPLGGLPHFTATTGSPGWTPVPNWAAWAPPSGTTATVIGAITRVLATQYRLASPGAPLVSVHAAPVLQTGTGPDSIAALAVQTRANSTHLVSYSTEATWEFRLCGSGPDCAITSGTPTVVRGRLVRREALELALYALEYAPDLGAVLVSMPPAPGSGPPAEVLYFRRAALADELRRPLSQTLPLATPPPATRADPTEAAAIDRLTLPALWDSQPLTSGTLRVLVLSPAS